jgi:hypothetical protein
MLEHYISKLIHNPPLIVSSIIKHKFEISISDTRIVDCRLWCLQTLLCGIEYACEFELVIPRIIDPRFREHLLPMESDINRHFVLGWRRNRH